MQSAATEARAGVESWFSTFKSELSERFEGYAVKISELIAYGAGSVISAAGLILASHTSCWASGGGFSVQ